MPRDFIINGEALVRVRFGNHIISGSVGALGSTTVPVGADTPLYELGLATEGIIVSPHLYHKNVHVNDFGGQEGPPSEVIPFPPECNITMTLIHYDHEVLDACVAESHGGKIPSTRGPTAGTLHGSTGIPLGCGRPLGASGNHYISVNISSPQLDFPWRFPASYLLTPPLEIPVGTKASVVQLNWKAIPYQTMVSGEIRSSGATTWDHGADA